MRRLSVFIEMNGENVYVGEIAGKDSTDACFTYADTYLENQEHRAISIGLPLEEEPEYGGRKYLEKQDYILAKQKEQLALQEEKLEELVMKLEDVETLIDEVSDIAYDKAVEVVTASVKTETHLEDIRLVEESKNWVLSPERKASKKEREYAAKRLDSVIAKIKNAMQSAVQKIQNKLMQPEVKRAGIEQIKTKARASVLSKLANAKVPADQKNQERISQTKIHVFKENSL